MKSFHGVRFLILAVVTMASCVTYIARHNINVTIVAMVKDQTSGNHSAFLPIEVNQTIRKFTKVADSNKTEETTTSSSKYPQYDWDQEIQGVILGSFFYSYIVLQIPVGTLVERYGGKWIILISLLGASVINALTPLVAGNTYLLVFSRILFGCLQAAHYPATFFLLVNWMPIKNRSFSYACMDSGGSIGSLITSAMSGFLAEEYGWPSVFFTSSALALGAMIIFFLLTKNKPEEHFLITQKELTIIYGEESLVKMKDVSTDEESDSQDNQLSELKSTKKIPWIGMLTCPAVLVAFLSSFCTGWTYYTIASKLPAYLKAALKIDLEENGLLNSMMYGTMIISSVSCGYLSERMIQNNYMSRTLTRKSFVSIAGFGSGFCLLLVPSVGTGEKSLMTLIVFSSLFHGFNSAGTGPLSSEMTVNYPATLYAIMNSVATSTGFIAPYVIGVILKAYQTEPSVDDLSGWHIVFYLTSGLTFLGTTVFCLCGSADRQSFDYSNHH